MLQKPLAYKCYIYYNKCNKKCLGVIYMETLHYTVDIKGYDENEGAFIVILSTEIKGSTRKKYFVSKEGVNKYIKGLKNHCKLMNHNFKINDPLNILGD